MRLDYYCIRNFNFLKILRSGGFYLKIIGGFYHPSDLPVATPLIYFIVCDKINLSSRILTVLSIGNMFRECKEFYYQKYIIYQKRIPFLKFISKKVINLLFTPHE